MIRYLGAASQAFLRPVTVPAAVAQALLLIIGCILLRAQYSHNSCTCFLPWSFGFVFGILLTRACVVMVPTVHFLWKNCQICTYYAELG